MRARYLTPTVAATLLVVVSGIVHSRDIDPIMNEKILPFGSHRLVHDPPLAHLSGRFARGSVDTVWFGGTDVDGVAIRNPEGTALADAVKWDFEDATLQGWTSVDRSSIGVWFRRQTSADFIGDPVNVAQLNGSPLLWVGRHQSEAGADCWPGGQGYGNGWGMHAHRTFTYVGVGRVTLQFRYFVDSEEGFDFTYVYVTGGSQSSPPLNTSLSPDGNGFGYSGDNADPPRPGIGSPSAMAFESLVVDVIYLPPAGHPFAVDVNFDSDPLYSDALDSFTGFLNSWYGPFGLDDFTVRQQTSTVTHTFDTGADGWMFDADPRIGTLIKTWPLAELDPIEDQCVCPLSDPGNSYVMIAAELDPLVSFPHPKRQHEELRSPPAYVGSGADALRSDRMVIWSGYQYLPWDTGVGYRAALHYYPWTCVGTGLVGWTIEPAGPDGGFVFFEIADCGTYLINPSGSIPPTEVDSLRVVFEILSDCDDFGTTSCNGPEQTNQTPYLDDIVIGLAGLDVNAPFLAIDLTYQDVFPGNTRPPEQTLLCDAAADVHSYYDNNRADNGDVTNATMGDSAVVLAQGDGVHVYLNYRVYPGPCMNRSHPWYANEYQSASSGDPGGWAEVEMDTVQTFPANIAQPGRYASYVHEGSPWFTPPEIDPTPPYKYNPANKIIEDGVLTPGSKIEYFFTSAFGAGPVPPRAIFPDTSGGFYLEFEVLPGYFDIDPSPTGVEPRAPCFLYVDAFDRGAELAIERWGLTPNLGVTTWSPAPHVPPSWQAGFYETAENWDRYDYQGAGTNVCAPLAREVFGDNGMSRYQSLVYRWRLYNTGTLAGEGLRDGDAALLIYDLISDDFGNDTYRKALWLSGNDMAGILAHPGRASANALLSGYARASLPDPEPYSVISGDESFCVRLDPAPGRDFPAPGDSYASLRGNGCPTMLAFNVIGALTGGKGNLLYVDQDGGGTATSYASVSNNQFTTQDGYGVVLDGFSLHLLRSTPDGFTGDGTDVCTDSTAIAERCADVFAWFQVPAATACAGPPEIPDVSPGPGSAPPARTALMPTAPNPFHPSTTVRYQLAEETRVIVQVFDVAGRRVRTLVDGVQKPDRYQVIWDGTGEDGTARASGVYWVRFRTAGGFEASTKLVLLQ